MTGPLQFEDTTENRHAERNFNCLNYVEETLPQLLQSHQHIKGKKPTHVTKLLILIEDGLSTP